MFRKYIAIIISMIMILSCITPCFAQNTADGNSDATVINVTDYGADPSGKEDSVVAVQKAIEAAKKAEGPVIINFPKGEYNFWPDDAIVRRVYISNATNPSSTEYEENSIRTIGMLFEDMKNVTIEGNQSNFVFHGRMMSYVAINCENIVFQNINYGFARPLVVDITVEKVENNAATVYIPDCYEYEVKNNFINFYGEVSPKTGERYWTYTSYPFGQVKNLNSGKVTTFAWSSIQTKLFNGVSSVEDMGNNRVKINYSSTSPVEAGENLQIREVARDNPSALFWHCKGVTYKNINGYFLHSFGIVGQLSEDITFDNVHFKTNPNSGTTTASSADMMQISGCGGKLTVKNCEFENPHDDPINIHGTFLQITKILEPNKIQVTYMHSATYGFPQFYVGNEVEFINRSNMLSVDEEYIAKVTEVQNPPEDSYDKTERKNYILTLDKPIPEEITSSNSNNYVVENITYTPEVHIDGCMFRESPVRGVLCTTRKKVVIENSTFENTTMAAIYISDDANNWYESGYCRDVTIRNNIFKNCGNDGNSAVIFLEPIVNSSGAGNYVHKNIAISGNTFYVNNQNVLNANYTDGLVFSNNKILSSKPASATLAVGKEVLDINDVSEVMVNLNKESSYKSLFYFNACDNVRIENNVYDSGLNKRVDIANMPKDNLQIDSKDNIAISSDCLTTEDMSSCIIKYNIDNPEVVSVNQEYGIISGLKYGVAKVSAVVITPQGNQYCTNEVTVNVKKREDNISIESEKDTIGNKGETLALKIEGENSDAVSWSIEPIKGDISKIASISEAGVITAIGSGAVIATAETTSGQKVSKIITISIPVPSINANVLENDRSLWRINSNGELELNVTTNSGFYDFFSQPKNIFTFDLGNDTSECEAVIKMKGATVSAYEETGFGFIKDVDNFVAVQRKNHLGTVLVNEISGSGSEAVRIGYYNSNEVYFKITKKGSEFEGFYSLDNKEWTKIGSVSNANIGDDENVKLGVWVANGQNNSYTFSDLVVNGKTYSMTKENDLPIASNVTITGDSFEVGKTIKATFDYSDSDKTSSNSILVWYVSDERNGIYEPINSAIGKELELDSSLSNKYVKASFIPVDTDGAYGEESELSAPVHIVNNITVAQQSNNRITKVGSKMQFEANVSNPVIWDVLDPYTGADSKIASIDKNGVLTALSNGIVEVRGYSASGLELVQTVAIFEKETGGLFTGQVDYPKEGGCWIDEDGAVHLIDYIDICGFLGPRNQIANLMLIDIGEKENCSATIKMTGSTKDPYEETGFGFVKDLDNFVAVQRKNHLGTVMAMDNNAAFDESVKVGYYNSNQVYFRIDKAGDKYTGFYSIDNKATWTKVGEVTNSAIGNNSKIGFWVAQGNNNEFIFEDLTVDDNSVQLSRLNNAPTVKNLKIEGTGNVGNKLSVSYDYEDADNDTEKDSLVAWYYSDTEEGTYKMIPNSLGKDLLISSQLKGKYVRASVIPCDEMQTIGEEVITQKPILIGERETGGVHLLNLELTDSYNTIVKLTPSFNSEVTKYDAFTTSKDICINVEPESDAEVSYFVNQKETESAQVNLSNGNNTIEILVENGGKSVKYTINVDCMECVSQNALLSEFTVDGLELQPSFTPNQTKYITSVTKETTAKKVTVKAQDVNAKVLLLHNDKEVANGTGEASCEIKLTSGFNYVYAYITAPDGKCEKVYRVIVIRNGYDDAAITEMTVGGTPVEDFDDSTYEYNLEVNKKEAKKLAIEAKLSSQLASATITVNGIQKQDSKGEFSLNKEDNVVIVAVKADDQVTNKYYVLNVHVKEADKTALEDAIDEADAKDKMDYTPETWEPFKKALAEAKKVLADENAIQEEVDNAKAALEEAMKALVKQADKTALDKAIQEADAKDKMGYTPKTWEPFKKALDAAKKVAENDEATQEEVDDAEKQLKDAMAGLQKASQEGQITTPEIIKGAEQVVKQGSPAEFTSNAEYDDFISVTVDNKVVSPKSYKVREGSTIVTLSGDFTKGLSLGKHSFAIESENGKAETTFTVVKDAAGASTDEEKPETGDNSNIALLLTIMMVCMGVALVIVKRRKKANI